MYSLLQWLLREVGFSISPLGILWNPPGRLTTKFSPWPKGMTSCPAVGSVREGVGAATVEVEVENPRPCQPGQDAENVGFVDVSW